MQLLFRTYPILLLLLAVITFGSALPNQILPQSVHSRGFSPDFRHAHHDLNRTALLSKRDLDRNRYAVTQYLGLGWFCYFNLLDIVTPLVQIAVQDMEHFFSTVLSMAGDIWANEPAQTWRGARYGEIILEMSSSAPIPWEWIHGYLIGAIWWVRSGMLASYETTYRNTVNGVWILVKLKLPPPPGAAAAA